MNVAGSTLLKLGSRNVSFEGAFLSIVLSYMKSPVIVAGFATYAMSAILWVYCLSKFDLSYVSFVSSLSYIFLIAVSLTVFHEQISMMKWAGCAFIMIGVFFWLKG